MRAFLSPGERAAIADGDRYPLPEETRGDGLDTEGDVIRRFIETFDATLIDGEPSRAPQPDEAEQLALMGGPPGRPSTPRAYRD